MFYTHYLPVPYPNNALFVVSSPYIFTALNVGQTAWVTATVLNYSDINRSGSYYNNQQNIPYQYNGIHSQ